MNRDSLNGYFDKATLSVGKKAEIKNALREKFPQYAENSTAGKSVSSVIPESENIKNKNTEGARAKPHRLRSGIAIAATAAVVLVAGGAYARNMDIEDTPTSPAANNGDTNQNEQIYTEQAKKLYDAAAMLLADLEVMGKKVESNSVDSFTLTEAQNIGIDSAADMSGDVLTKVNFAALLYKSWSESNGFQLTDIDFIITFIDDGYGYAQSVECTAIIADRENDIFYTYPSHFGEDRTLDDGEPIKEDFSDEEILYQTAVVTLIDLKEKGYSLQTDMVNRDTLMDSMTMDIDIDTKLALSSAKYAGGTDFAALLFRALNENTFGYGSLDLLNLDFEIRFSTNSDGIVQLVSYAQIKDGDTIKKYPDGDTEKGCEELLYNDAVQLMEDLRDSSGEPIYVRPGEAVWKAEKFFSQEGDTDYSAESLAVDSWITPDDFANVLMSWEFANNPEMADFYSHCNVDFYIGFTFDDTSGATHIGTDGGEKLFTVTDTQQDVEYVANPDIMPMVKIPDPVTDSDSVYSANDSAEIQ